MVRPGGVVIRLMAVDELQVFVPSIGVPLSGLALTCLRVLPYQC